MYLPLRSNENILIFTDNCKIFVMFGISSLNENSSTIWIFHVLFRKEDNRLGIGLASKQMESRPLSITGQLLILM